MSSAKLYLDTAQPRLKEDGLSTLTTGHDWDPATASNVLVDPATFSAMLLPGCLLPGWTTTNSGIYSKIPLSGISDLTDSANWKAIQVDQGGEFYQYMKANTGGLSGDVDLGAINLPIVLEFFGGGGTNSARGTLEFGWGTLASTTANDVSGRVYDDGKVQIWKSSHQVGEGSISEKKEYADAILGNAAQNVKSRYVTMLLIPCRDRELLVASTQGGAFSHIFEDLAEATGGLTIVPSGKFWFTVPPGISCQGLRISYLQFVSSGSISGRPTGWRLAPAGTPSVHVYRDLSNGSGTAVTATASTTGANPYSVPNPVQLVASLSSSDSSKSPFLYAVRAYTDPQVDNTSSTDIDATADTLRLSMDVGDAVSGAKVQALLTRPDSIDSAGSPGIDSQFNRPFEIRVGGSAIFKGIFLTPELEEGYSWRDNDSAQKIELSGSGLWELAEWFRFSDPIPLDGYSLGDAFRLVASSAGLVANVSSSADSIPLGNAGIKKGSDGFNLMIEVGDTASEWLTRLQQSFAGLWHLAYNPTTGEIDFTDPADMPSTPLVTLYASVQDAITYGGYSDPAEASRYVYRSRRKKYLKPEANDVYIMGMDYRTGRPIIVHRRDSASADPTTAPGSRPANWLGALVKYSWLDGALSTESLCNDALDAIYTRVTAVRELHEITCERISGGLQGQLIKLKALSTGSAPADLVTGRIKSYGIDFRNEDPARYIYEPSHYVLEAGSLVCPLGVPGSRIDQIVNNHRNKTYSDYTNWGLQMTDALQRVPLNVQ